MIHAILNGDFSHALETLLAVSVLLLIVLMLRRPVARRFGAGVVYLLWAIPAARFFLPPLQTQLSMLNLDFAPAGEAAADMPVPLEPDVMVTAPPPVVAAWTPAPETDMAVAEPGTLSLAAQVMPVLLIAAVAAWVAGAVFLAARNLIAHWRFMQTVDREAMPVPAPMADLVARVAAETGLRRPPRLVASLISRGPFVTGLFRPVVVVPAWFEDDYTPMEARAALAHELMHVRRGDLWALQVCELFVAAMWFNPLAYIARNAFRTDQEAACDADVLARCQTSPHAYGSTLIKAARLHLPEPALATGRLPLTHALKERLTRMTYPAPSSRRRMIGFGAALLFGASTLAITASVAAAAEPENKDTHEFRIETDGLLISSEDTDRQIVLLGDPMAKVMPVPPIPPELAELEARISTDVAELPGPSVLGDATDMTSDPDFIEITRLSTELAGLGASLGVASAIEALTMDFNNMSEAEIEAWAEDFEARMEAKSAEIEARAADMELRMEIHADRLDQNMDEQTEARVLTLERRIEASAGEIEKIMEARFGPAFEAKVEAQAAVIDALMESCKDAELAAGETRILERADADGEVFRLACVQGNRDRLKAAETLAVIGSHPGITAAEKAAFNAAAAGERRRQVMVIRADASEAPAPPEPPAAPEPPLKGE